jgi:hypothetical protein
MRLLGRLAFYFLVLLPMGILLPFVPLWFISGERRHAAAATIVCGVAISIFLLRSIGVGFVLYAVAGLWVTVRVGVRAATASTARSASALR